jgi:Rad3-related DNA helicase
MQIDFEKRRLKLSVSELANFEATPKHGFKGGQAWRAALGQKWHQIAQERCIIEYPDARFEVALSQQLTQANWSIHLSGRIDQVIPIGNKLRLREVKTVRTPLPASPESLVERYPSYFKQLACYLALARKHKEWRCYELSAELYGIQIDTGTTQCIPIDPAAIAIDDEPALANLIHQLELRRSAQQRWQSKPAAPPFEKLRPGQAAIIDSLQQSTARHLLLEAPTGFGKTGLVLQYALQQLQTGAISRCLYLTAKSSGQTGPIHQLQKMTEGRLPFVQMHSRQAHAIDCAQHSCTLDSDCDINLAENWKAHAIEAMELCASGTLSLERAQEMSAATGICPYNLSCSTLAVTPFWVGDFNYIFSPSARTPFLNVPDFDPATTLLIIDEAHNLCERVEQARCVQLKTAEWVFLIEELKLCGFKRTCLSTIQALLNCIDALNPCQRLSAHAHYELLDLSEDATRQLCEAYPRSGKIPDYLYPALKQIEDLAESLNQGGDDWLHWIPSSGILQANCLNSGPWVQHCLQDFAQCIHLSATLSPHAAYCKQIGIAQTAYKFLTARSDWRTQAYQVAIDCRVDTRFAKRSQSYARTADSILKWQASNPSTPFYVFFPSFEYAHAIKTSIDCIDPYFRIAVQARGSVPAEQADFLDYASQQADAIFLITGSVFAEGIDSLGAAQSNVLVVSPALPEISAITKAKMEAYTANEKALAFHELCSIPAMRKIQQALGRFVRQPGESARVLLHCQRFADTRYQDLLQDNYPAENILHNEGQFEDWLLKKTSHPSIDGRS